MLVFCQYFGVAILLPITNTVFDNSLLEEIHLPNAKAIIAAGALGFRNIVSADQLSVVLDGYAISFDRAYYIAVGTSVVAFLAAFGMGWVDVRRKKKPGMV
jgi:hypothetical protein